MLATRLERVSFPDRGNTIMRARRRTVGGNRWRLREIEAPRPIELLRPIRAISRATKE